MKTGHELKGKFLENLNWRLEKDGKSTNRVLNINDLADDFAVALHGKPPATPEDRLTSADFALQMVEGVPRVRYLQGKAVKPGKP